MVASQEEAQRVMETPLEFGGNVLHVAPWVPPTKNHKSILFLRNVPSHKDAVIGLFKMFEVCHPIYTCDTTNSCN